MGGERKGSTLFTLVKAFHGRSGREQTQDRISVCTV